jgi:16S rRNA (guanine966-N2)-methyltransferase
MATRPTSDRLRETLFNVLAPRLEGAVFADLYAGSGAVGIEALSRGASLVYFVESHAAALAAIRENLHALNVQSGFKIFPTSAAAALPLMTGVSILFLDPPYSAAREYERTLGYLGQQDGLLAPGALIVAEHGRKIGPGERYGSLRRNRILEQGDAALSFYAKEEDAASLP